MWASTCGAPPVVVVTWKRSVARRPITPSSMQEPGFAQHQAIAAAADLELPERVGVHAFRNISGVGADDLDLAERRGVEQADACPHRQAFARDRVVHASPPCGKYQARFHWPTSSNAAPFSAAQSWMGVRRTGSNRSPRAAPAKAPNVTGV